jgi:hypothetical protein
VSFFPVLTSHLTYAFNFNTDNTQHNDRWGNAKATNQVQHRLRATVFASVAQSPVFVKFPQFRATPFGVT